ncbi:MAG: hypothetical protein HY831_00945 [Candidatus Aenigmarchaeota archaeon]|nr:hypothetical protein [Candidatus Aenigmarchaeota archaeon]
MKTQISSIFIMSIIMILSLAAFAHGTGESHIEGVAEAQVIGDQSANINFEDSSVTEAEIQSVEEEFNDPGLLPDHPFYGFKRFGEDLSLFFAFENMNNAKIHLDLAKKRLAEAKALLEKREDKLAEKALQEHEDQIKNVEERKEDLRKMGKDISTLMNETDRVLQKSIMVLELVKDKLPETSKERLNEVIKKQVEEKTINKNINATKRDIEIEQRLQEKIKLSMYQRVENRFENKIDKIESEIEKAKLENNTEKVEKLTEIKNTTLEQKQKSEENLEKLIEKTNEIVEKHIETINQKIEKVTDKLNVKMEGNISSETRDDMNILIEEIQLRQDGDLRIELTIKDGSISEKNRGNMTVSEKTKLETLKQSINSDTNAKLEITFISKSESANKLEEEKEKVDERLNKTLEHIGENKINTTSMTEVVSIG